MSSERQSGGSTVALARQRHEAKDSGNAEVIDLVQLPRGTRPTPIAYVDFEEVERLRVLDCENYQGCLAFVAEVRWRSFHCRQCPVNPERAATLPPPEPTEPVTQTAKIIELP